jgi:hypothetical protein
MFLVLTLKAVCNTIDMLGVVDAIVTAIGKGAGSSGPPIHPHALGEHAVPSRADPGERSRWRSGMTEFEHRQFRAIRDEFDRAHVDEPRPVVNANVTASPPHLSSNNRT